MTTANLGYMPRAIPPEYNARSSVLDALAYAAIAGEECVIHMVFGNGINGTEVSVSDRVRHRSKFIVTEIGT